MNWKRLSAIFGFLAMSAYALYLIQKSRQRGIFGAVRDAATGRG